MSFVQREIDRLNGALNSGAGDRSELYAAQQALSWALEPGGIRSPYEVIIGIPGDSKDYSAPNRPLPS